MVNRKKQPFMKILSFGRFGIVWRAVPQDHQSLHSEPMARDFCVTDLAIVAHQKRIGLVC